ncbi:MAG TPA: methyltransferase domain-containing protein [Oculatellaceae cyanobacterium]
MGLVQHLYSQFSKPRGVLGYVADWMMSHRPENIQRNEWGLSLLTIQPGDRILEIGFGPGVTVGKAAATAAEVVGVNHSELMVRQATLRNKDLIDSGKLKLMLGSVETLKPDVGLFDKIYSMNSSHINKHVSAFYLDGIAARILGLHLEK